MTRVTIVKLQVRHRIDVLFDAIFGMRYGAQVPEHVFTYCYGYTARGTYRRALRKLDRERRKAERDARPLWREEKVVREYDGKERIR
jgi:hypothetical protein